MARSRRRMARPPRKRADWVYRPDIFDEAGALIDGKGTYSPRSTSVSSGIANAVGKVLYDSHNRLSAVTADAGNVMLQLPRVARAEGSRAQILAVSGQIVVIPSTWSVGTIVTLGFRISEFEQSPLDGTASLDAGYSMLAVTNVQADVAAVWANDRSWDWETRNYRSFETGATPARWVIPVRFRCRRRLKPNMGYFLYMENSGTVSVNVIPWLRTLVVDEG